MGVWARCALPMHDAHPKGVETQPHGSGKHGVLQDDSGADPIDQQSTDHDLKKCVDPRRDCGIGLGGGIVLGCATGLFHCVGGVAATRRVDSG